MTFQDSDWFLKDSKTHINPKISAYCLPYISSFYFSLTDFQNYPGPDALFQDFPVLENATIEFQDFPGFPGDVRTL